jgi:hypothetical protein
MKKRIQKRINSKTKKIKNNSNKQIQNKKPIKKIKTNKNHKKQIQRDIKFI